MDHKTNIQICSEKARALYENELGVPLLQQICMFYNITVAEFGKLFGMSRSAAHEIMTHQRFPSMELGFAIARYFEVEMEWLFGWRVDDNGFRRPLVVDLPESNQCVRLGTSDTTMVLVDARLAYLKKAKKQDGVAG